jgi:23S rRNA pseudouridine2605 synthase
VERLQKVLARAGIASRRASEQLIKAGRVRVNGRVVTELGTKVDPHRDRVEVDGKRLVAEKPVYYVLHKPREMVTTLDDPEGRATIADLLRRIPERVVPVGRLDYHTSGALLVTNDGDMVDALLRPRAGVPKVYAAKLQGHLDVAELEALRNGVALDDGYRTKKAEVFVLREEPNHTWVQITLTEGKNRQIHRMGEAIGHRVMRLARQSFAGISIEGLRPGECRELKRDELQQLKKKYLNPSRHVRGASKGA